MLKKYSFLNAPDRHVLVVRLPALCADNIKSPWIFSPRLGAENSRAHRLIVECKAQIAKPTDYKEDFGQLQIYIAAFEKTELLRDRIVELKAGAAIDIMEPKRPPISSKTAAKGMKFGKPCANPESKPC